MTKICIYHAHCADGFGAAWAVNKAHPGIELYAASYGEPAPDVTGRDVIMVDFSYKRPVLDVMIEQCHRLTILDHHKTAQEDLAGIFEHPKVDGEFDMDRSGAMMAWEWFHAHQEAPQLLQHIQDRDLWRFEIDGTRAIMAAVFSYPQNIATWDKLAVNCDKHKYGLHAEGQAILRAHDKNVHEVVAATRMTAVVGGFEVPTANVPHFMASDAGHILCKDIPFAAVWYAAADGVHYSLRSEEGGQDVSEVAKLYGGGGHKHAAGFTLAYGESL